MEKNTQKTYLISGLRTPFGKFGGSLAKLNPVDLSVHSSKGLLEQSRLSADKIDHVIFGNVVPTTPEAIYGGRHVALKIGCDQKTPAYSVNRLCGSGFQAMWEARHLLNSKEANCVLVSGSENLSMTPHLTYGARFGTKYGSLKSVDLLWETLTDRYTDLPMGVTAENLAKSHNINRTACDDFGYSSHAKAEKATQEGLLKDEIISIPLKKGEASEDENIRLGGKREDMDKLRPTFSKDGVITPGSASGIVDGAASVLIANEDFCNSNGLTPACEIIGFHVVGVDPSIMGIGPVPAIQGLLEKTNMNIKDIDLFEINEAFAPQALACIKDLEIPLEKINVWGGAIAIGHPFGATGVRMSWTLARQLKHYGKKYGIASACIGGGQGIAVLIKNYE